MATPNIAMKATQADFDRSHRWQVVFRTDKGLDYCRETVNVCYNAGEIQKWAAEQCVRYGLAGAVIEAW